MSDTITNSSAVDENQKETQAVTSAGRPNAKPSKSGLYTFVWRWHFYAGILSAPILWMITITGAMYVFSTEISEWRDQALLKVSPQAERVSYDRLREIATSHGASEDLEGMVVRSDPAHSVFFLAHIEGEPGNRADDQHQRIYLNPYDGSLLGTRIAEHDFFAVVLELHRSLMLLPAGD